MRVGLIASLVCLFLVGLANADPAHASIRKTTNIPAEELGSALQTLARDYDFQVLYRTEIVKDLRTQGAVGSLTSDEALGKVLKGTGLSYKYLDSNTVTIYAVSSAPSGTSAAAGQNAASGSSDVASTKGGGKKSSQDFRVAQVDQNGAGPQAAINQFSGKKDEGLAEIIVTAQKREQRLIDVPISIVAVSADELAQRQIATLDDLASVVPGLSYIRTGNQVTYQIRGVSNSIGSSALVGTYIDEADATLVGSYQTAINPGTYDLDRVEVLRGPQGTLYGEGSAGGTVRLITKDPNLSSFAFDSQVAALFTERGGPSQRINAMVNVPVIEDQLGLRIATTFEHDGGWIEQPAADQKDINWQDLTNVRVKGLWKPDPQLTVSAMAIISRNDRGLDVTDQNSSTNYTQVFNLTTTPRATNDYDLYNLTITYDLPWAARILNTASYIKESVPETNVGFLYPGPPGMPVSETYFDQFVVDRLFTDELRLTSTGSGPWQWTFGGFYRRYDDSFDVPAYYYGSPGPPGTPLPTPGPYAFDTRYKSWSAFGDTSYQLWDRFTVGTGVRYFGEQQNYTSYYPTTPQNGDFHSLDPRVYAQYKLTSDINVYASAAKGFRSGGFNPVGQPTFAPESVWTYELGAKMALLENRIVFDADVFLTNYTNYQSYGFPANSPSVSYTFNAGAARIKGIEADVTWQPLSQWRMDVRGDYMNGRFTEVNGTGTADMVGDPIDLVPRYQFTVSGQHDFSWFDKHGFVRLDYNQQGPMTTRNDSVGPWYYGESAVIHTLNLDTSLRLNDTLSVGFFAQNLLNDQGFVNPFGQFGQGVRPRPRTYGINFSVKN